MTGHLRGAGNEGDQMEEAVPNAAMREISKYDRRLEDVDDVQPSTSQACAVPAPDR
jgi:hypothetical protein